MNTECRRAKELSQTSEQLEWHICHAQQQRNETIARTILRLFALMGHSSRHLLWRSAAWCSGDRTRHAEGRCE